MKATDLKFVLMSSLIGLSMAACSPMSDNSLLTDKKDDNSSLTVDKTPKAEELYLKLDTSNIGPAVTGTKLEVSGECYTSTYTKHRIIAREGGNQLVLNDLTAAAGVANEAQCRNGRFTFSLNVTSMGAGGHRVRVSLEAYDGLSALVLNENQGAAELNFTR